MGPPSCRVGVEFGLVLAILGCGGGRGGHGGSIDADSGDSAADSAPRAGPGTPDPGFGSGGLATSGLIGRDLGRAAIGQAATAGEAILVGGKSGPGGATRFVLSRFTADGLLDVSFGAPTASPPGFVTTRFDPASYDEGKSLALQSDGAIVFAGITTIGNNGRFGVARFSSAGIADTSYGGTGRVTVNFSTGNDEGKAVAIQPCAAPVGCAVVVGKAVGSDGQGDFALARLDDTGRVVRAKTDDLGGPNDEANDVIALADGRFVVAGESGDRIAVARYTPAGDLDPTFGDPDPLGPPGARTGTAIIPVNGDDHAYAVAIDGGGRIVAVGRTNGPTDVDQVAIRLTADGQLDGTFAGTGIRTFSRAGSDDIATGVTIDARGHIAIAGRSTRAGASEFTAVRVDELGADDPAFGDGGRAVLAPTIPTSTDGDDGAYGMVAQGDGKLVLVGELRLTDDDLALVRVLP